MSNEWQQPCPMTKHVDGKSHGLRFDGDDPYTICVWCGETRDVISGRVIEAASTHREILGGGDVD